MGRPLAFEDLLESHEAAHGPLWRYGAAPHLDHDDDGGHGAATQPSTVMKGGENDRARPRGWGSSTAAERELYAAITARVDDELKRLEGLLP